MPKESKDLGKAGEQKVVEYLGRLGWEILEMNFRSHHGEIDIIAKDRNIIIFIEVKNYSYRSYCPPAYSIRKAKKSCIIFSAKYYLMLKNIKNINCRFDVVTLYKNSKGEQKTEHFKNAFTIN